MKIKIIVALICLTIALGSVQPLHAWSFGEPLIPTDCTGTVGSHEPQSVQQCNLEDIFQFIINISFIIVGLTGSAALLMFTYGGVLFILASGEADKINKAKEVLKAAVIGIAIILLSWIIVNTVIAALTEGRVGGQAFIFGDRPFNQQPEVNPQ